MISNKRKVTTESSCPPQIAKTPKILATYSINSISPLNLIHLVEIQNGDRYLEIKQPATIVNSNIETISSVQDVINLDSDANFKDDIIETEMKEDKDKEKVPENAGDQDLQQQQQPFKFLPRSSISLENFHWRSLEGSLHNTFTYFEDAQATHDLVFIVGPLKERIFAHSLVVWLNSPACEDIRMTKEVVLKDVRPDTLRILLKFMYTKEYPEEEATTDVRSAHLQLTRITEVADLARETFCMNKFVSICYERIYKLWIQNAVYFWHIARNQKDLTLFESAHMYILTQVNKITEETDQFDLLSREDMSYFLSRDDLAVKDELEVFIIALKWAKSRCAAEKTPEKIREAMGDILYKIRFPQLSPGQFKEHVIPTKILNTEEENKILKYFFKISQIGDVTPFVSVPRTGYSPSKSNIHPVVQAGQGTSFVMENKEVCVILEDSELWGKFKGLTNEMIVTKTGRQMFPSVRIKISGLDPDVNYSVMLEFVQIGSHRWKYLYQKQKWTPGDKAELTQAMYVHPNSPQLGADWTKDFISFRKLKLTNHKIYDDKSKIFLHSLHKYEPRVHIVRVGTEPPGSHETLIRNLGYNLSTTHLLPATQFIALTAYQNENVRALKILHNPFAKGFLNVNKQQNRKTETSTSSPPSGEINTTSPSQNQINPSDSTKSPLTPNMITHHHQHHHSFGLISGSSKQQTKSQQNQMALHPNHFHPTVYSSSDFILNLSSASVTATTLYNQPTSSSSPPERSHSMGINNQNQNHPDSLGLSISLPLSHGQDVQQNKNNTDGNKWVRWWLK